MRSHTPIARTAPRLSLYLCGEEGLVQRCGKGLQAFLRCDADLMFQ